MQNVVNLFARRNQANNLSSVQAKIMPNEQAINSEECESLRGENSSASKLTFSEIAAKNAAVQEKLKKEREQANKNVLKSYRIK